MNFKICAKSNIGIDCLKDRKNKGFDNFELYTSSETFSCSSEEIASRVKESGLTCRVVHVPDRRKINDNFTISYGISGFNSEVCMESIEIFKKTIDLAERLFETEDRFVVIHPGSQTFLSKDTCNIHFMHPDARNESIRELRKISINNTIQNLDILLPYAEKRNVKICLENMPSLDASNSGRFASHCSFVYPEDFKILSEKVSSPYLYFTLDTCHIISQARVMRLMLDYGQIFGCNLPEDIERYKDMLNKDDYEILMVEAFLDIMKDRLGVIHLNNALEFGMQRPVHSTKFSNKDIPFLKRFFEGLSSIEYSNPITLEINVEDFENAVEQKESFDVVKSVIKNE